MFKKLLNARILMTFGLVSLVISALLGASFLGAIPDRHALALDSRAKLAETVAATMMINIADGKIDQAQAIMEFVLKRNPELISLGLRAADKNLVAQTGDHDKHWSATNDGKSSETQWIVPLASKQGKWGQTELHFKAVTGNNVYGWVSDERLQIILIVALFTSFSFYFYLGRMLKQLDPSRAVPDRVKSALDTLSEGLLLLDPQGNIVLANQAFAKLVGQPQESLLGKTANSFKWQQRTTNTPLPWELAITQASTQLNVALGLVDPTGRNRFFLSNSAPVLGAKNEVGGVLISLADVTALEEKEQQLIESKSQADSANRAKSDFLANMSHEIRTPMNAILGFTDILRRGMYTDSTEATKHLNTVHSSGTHLLGLINDILDLSKVEAGKLEVEMIPSEIHGTITEVVTVMNVKAQEKGIDLIYKIEGKVPQTIDTDTGRLRQMVTNLVGNAVKFTEKGSVVITQRWDSQRNMMYVQIADSGIGIPADKLESIFTPFEQAETSTTRRFGGTGLGLSISQKFARALGGDIHVASHYGKGSQFTIILTAANASSDLIDSGILDLKKQHCELAAPMLKFANESILVVDDSIENRELIKAALSQSGLQIDLAENGLIGVQMASKKSYSVILMDMQMPVMDGFTATRELRKLGNKKPIIAFTAHALKGFENEISEAGCTGYLTKPVDLGLLNQLLATHIKVEGIAQALTTEGFGQKSTMQEITQSKAIDTHIHSRLANYTKLHSVINIFVQRLPKQLQLMRDALASSNLAEVANLAHWLKGSAGSVGFDSFTEPAKRLEDAAKTNQTEQAQAALAEVEQLATRIQLTGQSQIANSELHA
jgi:PAS domain S-box-containing protein